MFALLLVLLAAPWGFIKPMPPALSFLLGALAFAHLFYRDLKRSRLAAERLPRMAIEVSPETLRFIDPGGMYEVPVASIQAMAVDRRPKGPRIIYLQRKGESTINIEDLDRMTQFEAEISRMVGTSKVRELKWWQGPPG
ncbi:hypothetical protein [Arenimonas sp. MALMAid1274]|uniref:hypothetical protein n=1 Tax=Arenimonas sp. MALMAid1274 TaxID=3411630 RepID=UPI003B9E9E05